MCVCTISWMFRVESAYSWGSTWPETWMYSFSSEWNRSKVLGMKTVVIIGDEVMNWINEFNLVVPMKPIINHTAMWKLGSYTTVWGEAYRTPLKFNIAREKLPYQKEKGLPTIHFQGIFLFKILEYTIWYLPSMYIASLYYIIRVIFTLSMYINIEYSVYTV